MVLSRRTYFIKNNFMATTELTYYYVTIPLLPVEILHYLEGFLQKLIETTFSQCIYIELPKLHKLVECLPHIIK